jgi:transcriptional regulator with XRE-family HTH domain
MSNLSSYLTESGVTQAEFAQRVGVGQPTISRLARGTQRPRVDVAVRIERESGGKVPVHSWPNIAAIIRAAGGAA